MCFVLKDKKENAEISNDFSVLTCGVISPVAIQVRPSQDGSIRFVPASCSGSPSADRAFFFAHGEVVAAERAGDTVMFITHRIILRILGEK